MKIINPISTYASSHPIFLVILSIISIQIGAAFSKALFPEVGSAGMVFLRVGFGAISLFALCRPKWTEKIQQNIKILIGFGVVMALMNLSFYAAIERIPIGIAVTLEFIGPLGQRPERGRCGRAVAPRATRWPAALIAVGRGRRHAVAGTQPATCSSAGETRVRGVRRT